jgi:LPXTG-site transpeptidase (sortase) family protein
MNDMKVKRPRPMEQPKKPVSLNKNWWQRFMALKAWKKILLILALILIIGLVINFSFFWQNVKYSFVKPQPVLTTEDQSKRIDPDTLIINSLGLKLPVVSSEEKTEEAYQRALQRGVVHFPDTAKAGAFGNVYIFGHSSDYTWARGDYKTAFALLPRIAIGAEIILSDNRGNPHIYKVVETKVVDPDDLSVLDQRQYKKRLLTLQTSYPIGTALRRFIVVAELTSDLDGQQEQQIPQIGT